MGSGVPPAGCYRGLQRFSCALIVPLTLSRIFGRPSAGLEKDTLAPPPNAHALRSGKDDRALRRLSVQAGPGRKLA
jgi:hypothetical protein